MGPWSKPLFVATCALVACIVGCNRDHPDYVDAVAALSDTGTRHEVEVRPVENHPTIWVVSGDSVEPTKIRCSNCHATREPKTSVRAAADLDDFHQGLAFDHGSLSCLSCHNRDDYDTLALADGTSVAFSEVVQLCGQCHGPQLRDYEHGAHGGGMGYWDDRKGSKVRNACVHCHDPHSPAFRQMQPTFKPKDRFLSDDSAAKEGH